MGYQTPDFEALLKRTKQTYRTKPIALRCGRDPAGDTRGDESH
jgi:hypothetical protein